MAAVSNCLHTKTINRMRRQYNYYGIHPYNRHSHLYKSQSIQSHNCYRKNHSMSWCMNSHIQFLLPA